MTMNPDDKAVPLTQDEGNVAIVQGHDDGPQLVEENVVGAREARQSHICCGCCCDVRLAVIVVNIISMCLAVQAIISFASMSSGGYYASNIGALVLGMICKTAGIYGAHKFNKIGLAIGAIWYALDCIHSIVFFDIAGAIMSGFFCYPHVVFLQEMNNGIMTPEKYPNEKLCCPCNL
jgi:hypothetical protein